MTHDQTTPAPVEVTQADRDAAEAFWNAYCGGNDLAWRSLSAQSQRQTMRAFARHRIAHSAPASDECPNPNGCGYCAEHGCPRTPADEVEPVAWQVSWHSPILGVSGGRKIVLTKPDPAEWDAVDPLYTHPAPPADVVEALEIMSTAFAGYADTDAKREAVAIADAALAKHGGA